jgi:hypothetical protein
VPCAVRIMTFTVQQIYCFMNPERLLAAVTKWSRESDLNNCLHLWLHKNKNRIQIQLFFLPSCLTGVGSGMIFV